MWKERIEQFWKSYNLFLSREFSNEIKRCQKIEEGRDFGQSDTLTEEEEYVMSVTSFFNQIGETLNDKE